MISVRRLAAIVGLVALGMAVAIPVAEAAKWHSKRHPLIAVHDGTSYAKAYGNFYNYRSESAHSMAKEADPHPGAESGHGVYVETEFWWYGSAPEGSCGNAGSHDTCWWDDVKKQSARSEKRGWVTHFRARNLDPAEDASRGAIKVCLDRKYFKPDWCSAHVIRTFHY